MHGNALHSTVSTVSPTQSIPPQDGAGLLQLLVLFLTPTSPHGTEQFPTDQFDQPPSTAQHKTMFLKYIHLITELIVIKLIRSYVHTWTTVSIALNSSNIFTLAVTTITTGARFSTITPLS